MNTFDACRHAHDRQNAVHGSYGEVRPHPEPKQGRQPSNDLVLVHLPPPRQKPHPVPRKIDRVFPATTSLRQAQRVEHEQIERQIQHTFDEEARTARHSLEARSVVDLPGSPRCSPRCDEGNAEAQSRPHIIPPPPVLREFALRVMITIMRGF